MYTVKRTESELWTVGEVGSNGRFEAYSDHGSRQEAEDQATRLNGGVPVRDYVALKATVNALLEQVSELEEKVKELSELAQGYQAAFYDEAYRNMKLAEENLELSTLE